MCADVPLPPRAPRGRGPRVLLRRRCPALLAAATRALFHAVALRAPVGRCPRVLPPRSSSRTPRGRAPRIPPPRRAPAPLAVAAPAFRYRAALSRPSRLLPVRPVTTSLRRTPVGRGHRVLLRCRSCLPPHAALTAAGSSTITACRCVSQRRASTETTRQPRIASTRGVCIQRANTSVSPLRSPPVCGGLTVLHLRLRRDCARSLQAAACVATAWAAAVLASARAARVATTWVAWRDDRVGRAGRGREHSRERRRGGSQRTRPRVSGVAPRCSSCPLPCCSNGRVRLGRCVAVAPRWREGALRAGEFP